ncbi:cysteine--tRNA ligase [Candidatus Purcelliella pentastirinorum]|nr:cysteine--tRNA ligase [Candidatus Purcelliella pentastirinorum]
MLKIYNTLSKKKEKFKAICNGNINLYVCGSTVYDLCHVGHARTFVFFDIMVRYLRFIGYNVKYVRNITDIDNKILNKAKENEESVFSLTNRMILEMSYDFCNLNILSPDLEPRVTDNIKCIIDLIIILLKKKYAYLAKNGDVLFSIDSYSRYGYLSGQNLKLLKNRIRYNYSKNNFSDFVLWKRVDYGECIWNSPWGFGRPGWHIECSAISQKYLGVHYDIHGGGSDLIFPHHENEIAQSICAYNNGYVNYWMHTGLVIFDKKKISKSNGNFFNLKYILSKYSVDCLRYFLISSHYRNILYYNDDNIYNAKNSLKKIYNALYGTNYLVSTFSEDDFKIRFCQAMNDDFNIPKVISILFELVDEINIFKKKNNFLIANKLSSRLIELFSILGIRFLKLNKKINFKNNDKKYNLIKKLILKRDNARRSCNWSIADKIRNKLYSLGVVVEDSLHRSIWKIK